MNSDSPTLVAKARQTIASLIEHVLWEETRLAATARQFAWRVHGAPAQSLKRLFVEQGRQIERWLSDFAARLHAVGAACVSSGDGAGDGAEAPLAPRSATLALLEQHERLIAEVRAAHEAIAQKDPDGDAALLIAGLLEFHETSAWMLRLLLEAPERARVL
jgi:DNA-binding ferritin-like protein